MKAEINLSFVRSYLAHKAKIYFSFHRSLLGKEFYLGCNFKVTYKNKIKKVLSKIDLDNTHINISAPIIFLCGGKLDSHTSSVRKSLVTHLKDEKHNLQDQIILIEEFTDWAIDATHKNLMAFEDDVAHISSLIIIILESPGSLAELGIFANNENLEKKILIFIEENHFEAQSFIWHGPIRHIDKSNNGSIRSYPWIDFNPNQNNAHEKDSAIQEHLPSIVKDIESAIQKASKAELKNFSPKNIGHKTFLTYEIIKICAALQSEEIIEYLTLIKIETEEEELNRILFNLRKLKFISKIRRGNNDYYYPLKIQSTIKFNKKFDPFLSEVEISGIYSKNEAHEKTRVSIIRDKKIGAAQ